MLHPIGLIKSENGRKEGIVFLDSISFKTTYIRLRDIQNNPNIPVVGVSRNSRVAHLYNYYKNIGQLGDSNSDSITVIKKKVSSKETVFLCSDTEGSLREYTIQELKDYISSGKQVAGARIDKNKRLCIASTVEVEVMKSNS